MQTPITVRIEADLLQSVRDQARQENRTLTNFIETVLRLKMARSASTRSVKRAELDRGSSNAS